MSMLRASLGQRPVQTMLCERGPTSIQYCKQPASGIALPNV